MINNIKLSCPFCGGKNIEFDDCKGTEACNNFEECKSAYYTVVCNINKGGCGASSGYYQTKEQAIKAWNRRVVLEDSK
ncbi:hypothetical protein Ga0466249_002258 [Sporomusaceae bacterium BoRhaA]|uniref:Lar family restriction alleviation protein n=1 Tax=Pelorhabdus rhamnosifermentans TaxID=2772457 RepID=UPI001C05F749|nr:Lar family restriction alleviation protein [Pelorhabdus rhamnosifermentans]MBU2701144.1 hypothetical protein [Pelorhabdus rhamnosifermentans]